MQPWVGQVLSWWPTPWQAVQEAAWGALNTPFAQDYSLSEESLPYTVACGAAGGVAGPHGHGGCPVSPSRSASGR